MHRFDYYFDQEEKEYIKVDRRYPYLPGIKGERPLTPAEIFRREHQEFFRERERTARKKAEEQELEQAAQQAVEKALKNAEKQIEKVLNK